MGNVLRFKRVGLSAQRFAEELEIVKALYICGEITKVLVICEGKEEKFNSCTSSGITITDAKELCKDFIIRSRKYRAREDRE